MPKNDEDFRHKLDCKDCWAWKIATETELKCYISKQNDNKPEGVDCPRDSLSRVYDSEILDKWPCEFRYTREEVQLMKSGEYREANVTKAVSEKVVKAAETVPGYRFDRIR